MLARVLLPVALVLALAGTAAAEKAKIAVLGLEVAGSVDTDSTSHGRLLTERFHAKVGISAKFTLAPNSKKDLLDEKVANSCDTETPECMAKIGVKLKAAYLLFGKIEKRPKDGKDGYQLSMKFLDVDKKVAKEWGDWLPLGDFLETPLLDARVSKAFDTLSKDSNNDAVVAPTPVGPDPSTKPKSNNGGFPWKTTAVASSAVTVVALAGVAFYWSQIKKFEDNCRTKRGLDHAPDFHEPNDFEDHGPEFTPENCATKPFQYQTNQKIAGVAAAAIGGLALFAVYKGFVSKKESPTQTSGRTRKKKQFAVTPIVSPDGGGATFRLDW